MIINLARRAHNHNWELDPITRSLLDTDFYKLLMLQFIWKRFPKTNASFSLINRSLQVRLGELVEIAPGHPLDVPLYWHRWRLDSPALKSLSETVHRIASEALYAFV